MPTAQYSSFDRGYDNRHTTYTQKRAVLLGRICPKKRPPVALRKLMAFAVVAIMAASAIVMVAPKAGLGQDSAPETDLSAHIQAGEREVTYTMSKFGESYLKDSSPEARGIYGTTPGVNSWWPVRTVNYGDTIMHNEFPYTIGYNPNSAGNTYIRINHAGYIMWSFYQFEMNARNVTTVATGPGLDPKFIPVLGNVANDGGNVEIKWVMTYLTATDIAQVKSGTYFANSYYSVPALTSHFQGGEVDEGWWYEHHGTIKIDRQGAQKFLNLPGVGNLVTEFNTANAGGGLNTSFGNDYLNEGMGGGIYDIFACYDYGLTPSRYWLSLGPESNEDELTVRLWGYSWGVDALMMRYMDITGLMDNWNVWPEFWYLNATITPTEADIHSDMMTEAHLTNWIDYGALKTPGTPGATWAGAWMMEATHADWRYDDNVWVSRYNDYDAFALTYRPGKQMWAPGSNYYGTLDIHNTLNTAQGVAYWVTPRAWDLASGEKMEVKLTDRPFWAVEPYKGTAAEDFAKGGSTAKVAEVMAHGYWGEMVLGHGPDSSLYSPTYYDSDTKTLTYVGPIDFTDHRNAMPDYSDLQQTGSPLTVLSVSKVSSYSMRIVEPGPYWVGETYTLEVTAKNYTDVTVTDWNGTVLLSVDQGGAVFGTNSLTFDPADGGVATTTIEFTTTGTTIIEGEDNGFPLDVNGELTVGGVDIPEFPTLLIPVIGAVAVFVAIRRRKTT